MAILSASLARFQFLLQKNDKETPVRRAGDSTGTSPVKETPIRNFLKFFFAVSKACA
jgi:hypothetical protein